MVGADEHAPLVPDAPVTLSSSRSFGTPGQRDADRWLAEHGDMLWRYVLARTRSASVAEEVVQETFLAALGSTSGPAERASERSWLLGIASHKIADHFRAQAKHRRNTTTAGSAARAIDDENAARAPCFTPDGCWAEPPSRWPEPAGNAEKTEQLTRMRRCMESLPPSLDQAIWLREVLGLTAVETCAALGLTAQALWTRMHRARSALRECMERSARDEKKESGR